MLVADQQQTLQEYLVSVNERIDEVAAENNALRNENETYRAENAAQRMERDAYKAKWESVPWEQINAMRMALAQVFRDKLVQWPSTQRAMFDVEKWLGENMPKEAAE